MPCGIWGYLCEVLPRGDPGADPRCPGRFQGRRSCTVDTPIPSPSPGIRRFFTSPPTPKSKSSGSWPGRCPGSSRRPPYRAATPTPGVVLCESATATPTLGAGLCQRGPPIRCRRLPHLVPRAWNPPVFHFTPDTQVKILRVLAGTLPRIPQAPALPCCHAAPGVVLCQRGPPIPCRRFPHLVTRA